MKTRRDLGFRFLGDSKEILDLGEEPEWTPGHDIRDRALESLIKGNRRDKREETPK